MPSMTQIKDFSQRIAKEFRPNQIILFGSHANGRPTQNSDVDMLIIMPFDGRPAEKSVEIRMKLRPDFPLICLSGRLKTFSRGFQWGIFSCTTSSTKERCFMKPIPLEWIEKAEGDLTMMERENRARKTGFLTESVSMPSNVPKNI